MNGWFDNNQKIIKLPLLFPEFRKLSNQQKEVKYNYQSSNKRIFYSYKNL